MKLNVDKVFVAHVKGATERNEHIRKELGKLGIEFEFMLDGDMADISLERLDKYFTGDIVNKVSPVTSCALKHLLIYEKMISQNYRNCLVLEDDIFLAGNFIPQFNKSMEELAQSGAKGLIISYEDSTLKGVPHSELKKGKLLYKKDRGRCTGAYYIDLEGARRIMQHTLKHGCHHAIDWYHNHLIGQGVIEMYWIHPPIATQGRHSGDLSSLLSGKRNDTPARKWGWRLKKLWKQQILNRFK